MSTARRMLLLLVWSLTSFSRRVTSTDDAAAATCVEPQEPTVYYGNASSMLEGDGVPLLGGNATATAIRGGEAIGLRYLRGVLSQSEARAAIGLCDARRGWTASPSRSSSEDDDSSTTSGVRVKTSRTSSSCPLIWPLLYLPRREALRAAGRLTPAIETELDLAWALTQRFAALLDVSDETRIEPLQLVRYDGPREFYRLHHDHGAYYGNAETEQRDKTLLVFLTSVPPSDDDNTGGHTAFPELGLSVVPRAGDAIVWDNVDARTGAPLDAAVHEAVPLRESSSEDAASARVVKVAMNVWIAHDPVQPVPNAAAYRTR